MVGERSTFIVQSVSHYSQCIQDMSSYQVRAPGTGEPSAGSLPKVDRPFNYAGCQAILLRKDMPKK